MTTQRTLREAIFNILNDIAQAQKIHNCGFSYDTNCDSGDGFISELFMASIKDLDRDTVLNIAIKRAPSTAIFSSVFNNEYVFYHTVFPALDRFQREVGITEPFVNIPKFYLGSVEPHKQFLAMEDLKIQRYEIHEKSSCLDRKHLEFTFKTYGKLHALNFAFKALREEEFNKIVGEAHHGFIGLRDVMVKPIKDCLEACMRSFLKEQTGTENENILERCQRVYDNLGEYYDKVCRYRGRYSCIIHGDCWSNNIFYKYKKHGELEDLKLIDFQFWNEDTPIHDLSYFFYSGASKLDFDRLDEYLEMYHDSFVRYAKKFGCDGHQLLPLDILKEEWKTYGLFGVFMGIMLWRIKLTTKENCQEYTKKDDRDNLDVLNDILYKAQETEEFKTRTKDIMRHAVDYKII